MNFLVMNGIYVPTIRNCRKACFYELFIIWGTISGTLFSSNGAYEAVTANTG